MMSLWTSRAGGWIALAVAAAAVVAVALLVELSPTVEGDFFFADDDPQMRASRSVEERFPAGSQLVLRVADLGGDRGRYEAVVASLTDELLAVDGVEGGFSITTENAETPLFRRILLTPDPDASNIVLQVDETDPEILLPRVERVVARFDGERVDIVISGVPAIVEMIRRSLYRDLVVFSGAAVVVFALLIGVVYRDPAIVVGTLATCLVSVGTTLLVVQAVEIGIGLLTANLVTIVFVLTLSHVVFLTGNWRQAAAHPGPKFSADAVLSTALRDTWEGSFWSMATTLLGFASLLIATARPLRELGLAGVVGTLTALAVAYLVYPAFLGGWARVPDVALVDDREKSGVAEASHEAAGRVFAGTWILPASLVAMVGFAMGLPRLDTDPGLLSYFDESSELYAGLARIDADGGSSTLDVVVADPEGAAVSSPEVFRRMEALQGVLEEDAAVGVVLSPTVLIEQARTVPLAGFLPVGTLLDIASSEALGGVALGFVTPDRQQGRFSLRMRETVDQEREVVIRRIRDDVFSAGLEPVIIAGLYDLQAQLGRLIASSLRIGIGGLLILFLLVAVVVSRSGRVTASMWVCLAAIPVAILGSFGLSGIAIDIITSPAANIALAVGADSMIHLVVRVRRLGRGGHPEPWVASVSQIGGPVLSATAIVCAGFGIFALSSFPPTQRFGLAVIIGTMTAATMALLVLPRLACLGGSRADRLSPS